MKKLLLVAVATIGFVFVSQAQEVKFGVKAGINIANLTGADEDIDARTSLHIGGVVEFPFSEKFALQPELLFSSQGAKVSESEEGNSYERKLKLNYLNIPVMAKLYLTKGFSLEAGPQAGFLLSAKDKWEATFGTSESYEDDIKDQLKEIDLSFNFGLGYKLENGLFFSGRYNLGFSDISDFEEEGDDDKVKNGVFQLSVGFMF
ncbi:porin family protein [Galbibacter sp. EGI 63066]|uniref:porin family protein n=1 Tax=Galbibacter sp. EGI 63066 TaxID=2993559 RepID=UPI002249339F|nr:porin family protein [Galbibacter sp. EGI 63066]MCX2681478.1 porin family protein [Galbibacter sp. EGI 63066]